MARKFRIPLEWRVIDDEGREPGEEDTVLISERGMGMVLGIVHRTPEGWIVNGIQDHIFATRDDAELEYMTRLRYLLVRRVEKIRKQRRNQEQ